MHHVSVMVHGLQHHSRSKLPILRRPCARQGELQYSDLLVELKLCILGSRGALFIVEEDGAGDVEETQVPSG